jgi:hypothetical protein
MRLNAFRIKAREFVRARNPYCGSVHTFHLINGAKNSNEAREEKTHHEKGKEQERKEQPLRDLSCLTWNVLRGCMYYYCVAALPPHRYCWQHRVPKQKDSTDRNTMSKSLTTLYAPSQVKGALRQYTSCPHIHENNGTSKFKG